MTIDELARRVGMTVRNVRAHHTRGLLPPPEVKGRTGFYDSEHVARLELIKEMQGAGFNLNAIKHVLDVAPPGSAEELLRFERSLMAPWEEEEPLYTTVEELAERFGGLDPKAIVRGQELGILKDLGDGRFEVRSPSLLRAGEEVVALGIPLDHALAVIAHVDRQSRSIAKEFVKLFVKDVWRPFTQAGFPEEGLPAIRRSLEKLRGIATDVVRASFNLNMANEVEKGFGKEFEKPIRPTRSTRNKS